MKKLIAITTIITALATSPVLAKTEGSYFGVSALRTKTDVKTKSSSSTNQDTYFNTKSNDSQTGLGINYKYAINLDNFFIAPGVFFDQIGSESKVSDSENGYDQSVKIKNRYGVRFDAGYDVTDKLAFTALDLTLVTM